VGGCWGGGGGVVEISLYQWVPWSRVFQMEYHLQFIVVLIHQAPYYCTIHNGDDAYQKYWSLLRASNGE